MTTKAEQLVVCEELNELEMQEGYSCTEDCVCSEPHPYDKITCGSSCPFTTSDASPKCIPVGQEEITDEG